MSATRYDCNCDLVIEMESMGLGVEEILQYARAVLTRDEVRALQRGLEEMLGCVEQEVGRAEG